MTRVSFPFSQSLSSIRRSVFLSWIWLCGQGKVFPHMQKMSLELPRGA